MCKLFCLEDEYCWSDSDTDADADGTFFVLWLAVVPLGVLLDVAFLLFLAYGFTTFFGAAAAFLLVPPFIFQSLLNGSTF